MNAAVIIPAFNAAAYVREAAESALRQTLPPAAVIVIDDGSTDGTADAASSLPGVTLLRQPNAGVSAARNRGAEECDAEWLIFLDADDRLCLNALSDFALTYQRRPTCRLIYGQAMLFNSAGQRTPHGDARSEGPIPAATRASFWKSALTTPGVAAIHRDLFHEVGGFVSEWSPTEDRDFWMKAGLLTEFAYTSTVVLEKRLHETNASHQQGRLRIQGARVQLAFPAWVKEHGLEPDFRAPGEKQILEQNLIRALDYNSLDAVSWLCEEAGRRGVESQPIASARKLLAAPAWYRALQMQWRRFSPRRALVGRPIAPDTEFHTEAVDVD